MQTMSQHYRFRFACRHITACSFDLSVIVLDNSNIIKSSSSRPSLNLNNEFRSSYESFRHLYVRGKWCPVCVCLCHFVCVCACNLLDENCRYVSIMLYFVLCVPSDFSISTLYIVYIINPALFFCV